MSDTLRFNLPLLDAAQAQKHVTVNEALARADILGAGRAEAVVFAEPLAPEDGTAWIVGTAASGAFAGQDDAIALYLNGGWEFVTPWAGCTVWIAEERTQAVFDGGDWVPGYCGGSPGGAATLTRVAELDQTLSGAVVTTSPIIPDKAIVLGVTGRVISEITGPVAWAIGVAGSPEQYGSGYGTALNAFAHGVSGQPQAFYGGTPLEITAEDADFTSGEVRLAVHFMEVAPPAAI